MHTINITAHFEDASQIKAIKAVLKAFKIKFNISKATTTYDPEFVAKIEESMKQALEGNTVKMSIAEFKQLCK